MKLKHILSTSNSLLSFINNPLFTKYSNKKLSTILNINDSIKNNSSELSINKEDKKITELDKKHYETLLKYVQCPISDSVLELDEDCNLKYDYIKYLNKNGIIILTEKRAEIEI